MLDPTCPDYKEKVDGFKAKYGEDLAFHQSKQGQFFVFKKPSRPVWKKFQQFSSRKGADTDSCGEQMVRDCYVFPESTDGKPDHAALEALFDDLPALPNRIFSELYSLAQGGEDNSGKL